MKTKIFTPTVKETFKPVGISIEFETEEELLTFWALTNTSQSTMLLNARNYKNIHRNVSEHYCRVGLSVNVVQSVFSVIDDEVIKRDLKW